MALNKLSLSRILEFVGASAGVGGARGIVPGPVAGDHVKFLRGDKTWSVPILSTPSRTVSGTSDTITSADNGGFVFYTAGGGCTVALNTLASVGNAFNCTLVNLSGAHLTVNADVPSGNTFDGGGTSVRVLNTSGINRLRLDSMNGARWFTSKRTYDSGLLTFASGVQQQLTHNLGAEPRNVDCYLHAVSTNLGFANGEYFKVGPLTQYGYGGFILFPTTTQVKFTPHNGGQYITRLDNGNNGGYATLSNWRVRIVAEF